MKTCPVCLANDAQLSHRRGVLEHAPLTWVGILPFRCMKCQTRFYAFALRDPRRKNLADGGLPSEWRRPPRGMARIPVVVTVHTPGEADVVIEGTALNTSLDGARLHLPVMLPEGRQVSLTLEGTALSRVGHVRWSHPYGESGALHGIQFQVPLERDGTHGRPLRVVFVRRLLRRVLIGIIGLVGIAIVAYAFLWLTKSLERYDPKHYEPKDIERQRYESQRPANDSQ